MRKTEAIDVFKLLDKVSDFGFDSTRPVIKCQRDTRLAHCLTNSPLKLHIWVHRRSCNLYVDTIPCEEVVGHEEFRPLYGPHNDLINNVRSPLEFPRQDGLRARAYVVGRANGRICGRDDRHTMSLVGGIDLSAGWD